MQHRPKMWILLLVLILLVTFEIGFQPIRFVSGGDDPGLAVFDYTFSEPVAEGEEALTAKLEEIKDKVVLKGVEQFEFIDPRTLRISTRIVRPEQREADRAVVMSALEDEYEGLSAAAVDVEDKGEEPLFALGPIGVFTPVPKIRLGLDLQGGAHVVLQCKPSTELTFTSPEDRPMIAEAVDAEDGELPAEAPEPVEEPAEDADADADTTEEPADDADAETPADADATDEPADDADAETPADADATDETADDADAETPADADATDEPADPEVTEEPADDWDPGETRESLEGQLGQLMADMGAEHADVNVVSGSMIKIRTRATDDAVAKDQRRQVQEWLQARYQGVQIDADEPASVFIDTETADKAKHIIDMRMYSMSDVKEPLVQKQGSDRIIVELPGVKDPARVTKILRSTAQLEFRLVPTNYKCDYLTGPDDYSSWTDETTGQTVTEGQVLAESEIKFTGAHLQPNAMVQSGQMGDWVVYFEMKQERKLPFSEFTRANIGNVMSIILDGETRMAPVIESELPGSGIIRGSMTADEASDLKLLLNAGALPVPLEIVENRQVSATLGADSVHNGMIAGIGGLICVMIFMVLYYRLPGFLANIALTLYIIIFIAALSTWSPLEATLTLPGIAGIILSIGMAVDANIIIFERLKEELRTRTTARAAAEAGFSRAWTAILDANVTTMMVAGALYFLGTSSIKSFAVTLFLGVAISLFTAVTVTRWLVFMAARSGFGENRWWFGVSTVPSGSPDAAGGSE